MTQLLVLQNYLSKNLKCKYSNLQNLVEKIENIKNSDPRKNNYIISDYDCTISKHHHQDDPKKQRLPGSCNVLEKSPVLPKEVQEFCAANVKTNYPIEMDPELSDEEKLPHLVNWWRSSFEKVIDCKKFTDKALNQTCIDSDMVLRDSFPDFFEILDINKIPMLIFSAGCGNIIEAILKHKYAEGTKQNTPFWNENISICSNLLVFDQEQDGLLVKVEEPMIHSLNKFNALQRLKDRADNNKDINNNDYKNLQDDYKKLKNMTFGKKNAILLGDHLRDVNMKKGLYDLDTENGVLNIGFLNVKKAGSEEKLLADYLKDYDLVLDDDQSFDVVNRILEYIYG